MRIRTTASEAAGCTSETAGFASADPDTVREADRTLIRRTGRTRYEHDAVGCLVRAVRSTLDGRHREWTYTWDAFDRQLCDIAELKGDEPGTAQRLMDAPPRE